MPKPGSFRWRYTESICGHPLDCGSVRGRCNRCHAKLAHLVRTGQTTWDEIEAKRLGKNQGWAC